MSREMREQTMHIMEALSGVDEEFLEQCGRAGKGAESRGGQGKILRYGSLCAACLCALLTGALLWGRFPTGEGVSGGARQNGAAEDLGLAPSDRPENEEAGGYETTGEIPATGEPMWIDLAELSEGKTAGADSERTGRVAEYDGVKATEAALPGESFNGDIQGQQEQELSTEKMSAESTSDGSKADIENLEKYMMQKREMPEDWQEACEQSALRQYIPRELPEGYERQQALRRTMEDERENLLLGCSDGEHMLWLNLTETGLDPEAEYDCDPPIFTAAGDWQEELPEPGEDGGRRFAVLYEDGVLAEYAGWLTEEEIRELFRSIPGPENSGQ